MRRDSDSTEVSVSLILFLGLFVIAAVLFVVLG